MADTWELYRQLVEVSPEGEEYIPRKPKDYAVRQGLTQTPLMPEDAPEDWDPSDVTPVVHAEINVGLGWQQQVQYR